MKITAKQMRAIEKSIGFPTTVSIETVGLHEGATLRLESLVHGQVCVSEFQLYPYREVPLAHVATVLVREMNDYIMNQQFAGVIK